MQVILLYDISDDRIRTRIADACLDFGLDRTQFSAFIGDLSRNHQEMLMLKLSALLGKRPGAILIAPISASDWDRRMEVRNEAEAGPPAAEADSDTYGAILPPPKPEEDPDEYPF